MEENGLEPDDTNDRPFHHPFQLKERPSGISLNLRVISNFFFANYI